MIVVTAAEMRELDRLTIEVCGTPGYVLMERAGLGATDVLLDRFPNASDGLVMVVAGKGNNGGDGFVIARALLGRGIDAEVLLLASVADVGGDAALALDAFRKAGGRFVEMPADDDVAQLPERLARSGLVVDAVFGTGLNSPVRGRFAAALQAINTCGRPVLAVDIPSGLDADSGMPLGVAVHAHVTATFAFPKVGQLVYPGAGFVGMLAVVDIGIAAEAVAAVAPRLHCMARESAARLVPARAADDHKGRTGHVAVFAGSTGHTGAARMAGRAALRCGAGLVTLAGPASLNAIFCQGTDELMTAPLADHYGRVVADAEAVRAVMRGKSAIVVGPGFGTHDDAARVVEQILREAEVPVVLDADALTCVARDLHVLDAARCPVLLTPHPGEMARLLGRDTAVVQGDRLGVARRFAAAHRCVLLLKGARTVVAAPDGEAWINPTGNPGMATGGMGDVLAGMLGALLAQGLDTRAAARLGAFLHGEAADRVATRRGMIGMLAGDVIEELPPAIAALCGAQL
jgi:NAD(P)H-hydrate epimerase